jgi:hypothetical protein
VKVRQKECVKVVFLLSRAKRKVNMRCLDSKGDEEIAEFTLRTLSRAIGVRIKR